MINKCEPLKTRVKLNVNSTRPHAISYTNSINFVFPIIVRIGISSTNELLLVFLVTVDLNIIGLYPKLLNTES